MPINRPYIHSEDIEEQFEWSKETFGPGERTEGCLRHIEKEIEEVRKDPNDLTEWIDIIILAIDGAKRRGYSGAAIVQTYHDKMEENRDRYWPDWREFSENEPIQHNREDD